MASSSSSSSSSNCVSSDSDINTRSAPPAAIVIVIMGVSGSGKSTIGEMLANTINCSFLDADDFHPQANKEKMSKGIPLYEEDRMPWLESLCNTLRENLDNDNYGKNIILGCSALKKRYRDVLRMADENYEAAAAGGGGDNGYGNGGRVRFVFLNAPMEVIAARLEKRAEEGKHFMPPTLLQSQLELLQIDDEEGIVMVDATHSPEAIVNNIRESFHF